MGASTWEYRLRFWIAALFFVAFGLRRGPRFVEGVAGVLDLRTETATRVVFVLAAVCVAMAAWLRTWGAAYLGSEVVHDDKVRTDSVVADGPYRHVRNPLYLATLLFAFGMGMCTTITGWCVLVGGLLVFTLRLIGREERALVDEQREAYVAYCEAVPNRLWPSLRPRVPARSQVPRWGQALGGEFFMWGCAAACLVGAATLRQGLAFVLVGVTFVAWVAVRTLRAARAEQAGDSS